MNLMWLQLIDDHVGNSVSRGEAHSMNAMDVDGASVSGGSERVANGVEDSASTQTESSHPSVSLATSTLLCRI